MAEKTVKKYGYIFNVDGEEKRTSENNFDEYGGIEAYKEDFPDASVRMYSKNTGKKMNVPLREYDNATKAGLELYKWEKDEIVNEPQESDFYKYLHEDDANADTNTAPTALTQTGDMFNVQAPLANEKVNPASNEPLKKTNEAVDLAGVRDVLNRNKIVGDALTEANKNMLAYGQGNLLGDKKAVKTDIEWNDETKTFDDKYVDITGGEGTKEQTEFVTSNIKPELGFANTYEDSEAEIDRRIEEVNKRLDEYTKKKGEEAKKLQAKDKNRSFKERFIEAFGNAYESEGETASKDLLGDSEGKNLLVQSIMLDQAKKRMQASKREKADGVIFSGQNWQNIGAGVRDAMLNPETLGGAVLTPIIGLELARLSDKWESGRELTEDEKDLAVVAGLLQEAQSKEVPLGYTAGDMFGKMLPFIAEIAFSPVKGTGSAVAKKLALNAIRKYGIQGVGKTAVKAGSRIIGDVAQASALAGTLQSTKVIGEAGKRRAGEAEYTIDSSGNIHSVGFKNKEGKFESIAKAFGSMAIENYTELLGEQFGVVAKGLWGGAKVATKATGDALGKVGKKVDEGLDVLARATTNEKGYKMLQDAALSGMSVANKVSKNVGKALKGTGDFLRLDYISAFLHSKGTKALWNAAKTIEDKIALSSLPAEILEEEAAIIINATTVGDEKYENLLDLEHQMQILCGVGLMSGSMLPVRGAIHAKNYRDVKKAYNDASLTASRMIGKSEWEVLRNKIDFADNNEIAKILVDVARSNAYSSTQKQAIETYAFNLERYRGLSLLGGYKRKKEEKLYESLYEQGYDAEGEDRKVIENEYRKTKVDADSKFEGDANAMLNSFNKRGKDLEQAIVDDKVITEEDKQILIQYARAKYRYDAMLDRVKDEKSNEEKEISDAIDAVTNKNTGTIMKVRVKGKDKVFYANGGTLSYDLTTGEVNTAKSSNMIVIYDPETKKTTPISKFDLERVEESINAETYKVEQFKLLQEQRKAIEANKANEESVTNEELGIENGELKIETAPTETAVSTERQKDITSANEELGIRNEGLEARRGQEADIEDYLAISYPEAGKRRANDIRKHAEDFAKIIAELEADRQAAIAYANGEIATEKPADWEYWAQREGLEEPTAANEELGIENGELKVETAPTEAPKVFGVEDVVKRVDEWNEKLGGNGIRVVTRIEDVDNARALQALNEGKRVDGWYDIGNDQVVIYAPNVRSVENVDKTYVHEVVSHKGVRGFLGKYADEFYEKVWNDVMTDAEREHFEQYEGVGDIKDEKKRRQAAADEYVAHLAEKDPSKFTAQEKVTWKKIVDYFYELINKLISGAKFTHKDVEEVLRMATAHMRAKKEGKNAPISAERQKDIASANEELGIENGELKIENAPAEAPKVKMSVKRKGRERRVDAKKEISKRLSEEWGDAPTEVREMIEELGDMEKPLDVEDIVYSALESLRSPKTKHKLILQGDGTIKGVADELGLPAKELQKMLGLNAFSTRANGGISLQKMAEEIADAINTGAYAGNIEGESGVSGGNVSDSEIRSMLIDAINSTGEPADMSFHRANRRIEMAERIYNDWKRNEAELEAEYAREADVLQAYEEFWLAEQEKAYKELPKNYFEDIFADEEKIRKEYEQRRTTEEGNQGSSEILHGTQIGERGRVAESENGQGVREEAGDSVSRSENADAQGGQTKSASKRKVGAKEELASVSTERQKDIATTNEELGVRSEELAPKAKAGENKVAKVEEAMREQKAKRVAESRDAIEKRLAEIRTELSEDREGARVQAQIDAAVELYGGYANAPADVRAKIDSKVAKISERRQELYAEELELENKLKALDKDGTRFSVKDGDKKNTAINESTNHSNADTSSGSLVQSAHHSSTATLSVPFDDAKVQKVTQKAKNNIRKFKNGDAKVELNGNVANTIADLRKLFAMNYAGNSNYAVFNTPNGTMAFRLGTHNAYGDNFAQDNADENVSVYVALNTYNHPESSIPYVEYKISESDFYENREDFVKSLVESVDNAITTGEFTQPRHTEKVKDTRFEITEDVEADEANGATRFSVKPLLGDKHIFDGLRKLEEGETSHVERIFSENKSFEFSSKNTIKGYDDVAFIFKELENESIENSFAVLVKKGKPTVIHLGMGSFTQTLVNGAGLNVAVNRIKPDKIYFVHNHPSGVLKSSDLDVKVLEELKEAYGEDVVQDGVIINTFSGKYGIFNRHLGMTYDRPTEQTEERPIKVYSFNKQVYDINYKPTTQLRSSDEVAAFVTSQRLGDRQKIGLIVVNNQLQITGNIFLPYSEFTRDNADKIANDIVYYTTVMGGNRAFLFGNASLKGLNGKNISDRVKVYGSGQIQMLDYVEIDGGRYKSAYDEGTRFRFIGEKGAERLDANEESSKNEELGIRNEELASKSEELGIRNEELPVSRKANLAVAKEMEANGKDAKSIKLATGWERGADKKWRYETKDFDKFDVNGNILYNKRHPEHLRYLNLLKKNHSALMLGTEPLTEAEQKEFDELKTIWSGLYGKLDNIHTLEAYVEDDELFKAYPELRDIRVEMVDDLQGAYGKFVRRREFDDLISVDDTDTVKGTIYLLKNRPAAQTKSTLAHEVQHVIQVIEGFAKGGNTQMTDKTKEAQTQSMIKFMEECIEEGNKAMSDLMKQRDAISDKMAEWRDAHEGEAFDAEWSELDKQYDEIDAKIDAIGGDIQADMKYLAELKERDVTLGYEGYRALAGEVESRNVQERLGMSAEERRKTLATETEDVPRYEQKVRFRVDDDAFNADIENGNKSYVTIGKANDLLKSLGMPKYVDIYVSRANLNKAEEKGIALQDIKNLPSAISEPLAVFGGYADGRSVAVLTNLKTGRSDTRYVWVTLVPGVSSIEAKINVVNRPVVGRKGIAYNSKIVDWINEGKMLYVDKEKMASYMEDYNSKYKNEDLISATEIVGSFENTEIVVEPEKERITEEPKPRKKVTFGEYIAPYYEGESYTEAMERIKRKYNVLDGEVKRLQRKKALGKEIDEARLAEAMRELEQAQKDILYLEVGPDIPVQAEGEDLASDSYTAKMEAYEKALNEWRSKRWGEDAVLDALLRDVTGSRSGMTDEEFKKYLEEEKERNNLSVKEMNDLVMNQTRERRRYISVENYHVEKYAKDIIDQTSEDQRKLIPHILEGSHARPVNRKDSRYRNYLKDTGKNDVSFELWENREGLLNDPKNVDNRAITANQHGLRQSDVIEYAIDTNAEILVTPSMGNALVRFENGDLYALDKYGVEYALYLKPEIGESIIDEADAGLLKIFLEGKAEKYPPKGLRDYVEEKEYDKETLDIARDVRIWFEDAWATLETEGMTYKKEAIEDYVTHIWDLKASEATAITTMQKFIAATAPKALKDVNNYVATNTPYMRTRAIVSLRDGMALGLVPKYEDIADIIRDYGHRLNESVANRRLVEFVKTLEVNGMPAIREVGSKAGNGLYVLIKNNALRGYEVHTDVKPVLDVVFGEYHTADSKFWQTAGRIWDLWGGLLKKLNLSMSFFHHFALTESAISMIGVPRTLKTVFKNILWDAAFKGHIPAFNDPKLTEDAVKHFVQLGATNDYMAKEVQLLTEKFAEKVKGIIGVEQVANFLDFANKGMDKALWDYTHDGLKIYSYSKLAEEIRAKAKAQGWSEETLNKALDEAGQLINDTFGGQHWDLLGFSPNAQKWARRLLLSPDWTLSSIRQALAPFGFNSMYADNKVWKRFFKDDPVADVRKKYGRSFWLTAALFFGFWINLLNAFFRAEDEEEEKKKADEIRKTNPNYKSPYEIKYPDGMRWWEYTMIGNAVGHKTHLFWGRYDDGTEQYVRWGKQFREVPELFYGRDGFGFPDPLIDKIAGKLNPMFNLLTNFIGGQSVTGFKNPYMRDKKGLEKNIGRLKFLVETHLPYSIPTDEEKEFKLIDLAMPSTKGFSTWKAIDRFKTGIKDGDMEFIEEVIYTCAMNGIDAETTLQAAMKQIEAELKEAMMEGVEDLEDAVSQYNTEANPMRKMQLKMYIRKQMSAQEWKDVDVDALLNVAEAMINGGVSGKNIAQYDILSNVTDVTEDWRIDKDINDLKSFENTLKELEESKDLVAIAEFKTEHSAYFAKLDHLRKVRSAITEMKSKLGQGNDAEVMSQIRELRQEAFNPTGSPRPKRAKRPKRERPYEVIKAGIYK